MKRTSLSSRAIALARSYSSSLPLDGPYCLPCVTRAHIFSHLFIIYVTSRTPGLARKSTPTIASAPSFFLDIMLAHLTVSPLDELITHARKTEAHTCVRTHARRSQAHAILCHSSVEEIGGTIIARFSSLTSSFTSARKWERRIRVKSFLFLLLFFFFFFKSIVALTHVFTKITYTASRS
ncbi:hypothetical protein P5V15_006144 [Pogonomyrmex californicus]